MIKYTIVEIKPSQGPCEEKKWVSFSIFLHFFMSGHFFWYWARQDSGPDNLGGTSPPPAPRQIRPCLRPHTSQRPRRLYPNLFETIHRSQSFSNDGWSRKLIKSSEPVIEKEKINHEVGLRNKKVRNQMKFHFTQTAMKRMNAKWLTRLKVRKTTSYDFPGTDKKVKAKSTPYTNKRWPSQLICDTTARLLPFWNNLIISSWLLFILTMS